MMRLIPILFALAIAACAAPIQPAPPATPPPPPATPAPDGPVITVPLTLTPAQAEGPYYPITQPVERDGDLTTVAGADGPAPGETLRLGGRILQPDGTPVAGALMEIWQTDSQGIYMHPQDPGYERRDRRFQFFGEARSDEQGRYDFITVRPGLYGGRPEHIHFKIKMDGRTILTSQFYFADDPRIAGSRVAPALVLEPTSEGGPSGDSVLTALQDIVISPP